MSDVSELQYRETMWAAQEPDCYDGKSCQQHRPQWHCCAAGDGDEYADNIVELAADTFPPGTKVVVSEPVCPHCGEVPSRSTEPEIFTGREGDEVTEYRWTCGCNFDWRAWAEEQYS